MTRRLPLPICVDCKDNIVNYQRVSIQRCPKCRNLWEKKQRYEYHQNHKKENKESCHKNYMKNRKKRIEYARQYRIRKKKETKNHGTDRA